MEEINRVVCNLIQALIDSDEDIQKQMRAMDRAQQARFMDLHLPKQQRVVQAIYDHFQKNEEISWEELGEIVMNFAKN